MIRLFCGHDKREEPGLHTFIHSVLKRSTDIVHFCPLAAMGLAQGSNAFTLSRFMVPALCGFSGHAIFCDASDMLMVGDVAQLDALFDPKFAVQVVQHATYRSRHERKYCGTEMECAQTNYPRKNWASVMLMNCEHEAWRRMFGSIPMTESNAMTLLQFHFLDNSQIGALPPEWNVLVDEGQPDDTAKILHWTAGIPGFPHYANARRSRDWFAERREMSGLTTTAHGNASR